MQVVKPVGWQCLLKQPALMIDLTIGRVGLPADLVSLIPDLVIMVMIDLAMMNFVLEVAIKQHVRCVRMALFS